MKFKIEKDTKVLTHLQGATYHIKTGFTSITTDVRVTFDMGDLWFAPLDLNFKGSGSQTLFAGNILRGDLDWYKHVIRNFYGFNLPKNTRNIDCIIVERANVYVIQPEDPATDTYSHIREEKRMLQRMKQPQGGYLLPGHLPK
ncbi:hypothetical protein LCGC14_1553110 [marine sediment metagenome]|uniref:Uncharacterized protein n=1 Tax=marine sediment metagenome TaxID=412755 RepID=A0A0F9IPQ6_9ZZZZ